MKSYKIGSPYVVKRKINYSQNVFKKSSGIGFGYDTNYRAAGKSLRIKQDVLNGTIIYNNGESVIVKVTNVEFDMEHMTLGYGTMKQFFPDFEDENQKSSDRYYCFDIATEIELFRKDSLTRKILVAQFDTNHQYTGHKELDALG